MAQPAGPVPSGAPPSRTGSARLRRWQIEALAAYEDGGARRDFLVTATPGSGKTAFALALAGRLIARRAIDRVVVVCPTDHLRTQWGEAAHRVGIELDPTLSNAVGPVRADLAGYVATYAQVAARPGLHAARTSAKRTLVILDEVHHAGDGLSWGEAVAEAFERAERRLCLTGTPFRTRPEERIPFVRYESETDGSLASHADFAYTYRTALSDGVVRPVVFAAYTGTARWRNSAGEVVAASLTEAATRKSESQAWRTALNPRGRWVPHVIAAMDERISHLRATGMPDAAGLVLASDQDDARAYAEIVTRITGEEPAVIISDDPKASERIAEFAAGTGRIAVCVRMISEGVDIPRAACLAWMTSYRTPLFFAQAVGRVVRARTRQESATVFLPAVRPLLALAAELETERNHVIPPPAPSADSLDVAETAEPGESDEFEALDAEAEFAHVLHGGRAVLAGAPERDPYAADDADYLGLPGLLSAEQAATLLAARDSSARARASDSVEHESPTPGGELASWRAAAELRREVNRMVAVLASRRGQPHAQIHAELRRAVAGPPSASATADILEARRDHLMSILSS